MNADFIKSIISLVIAVIPLIIVILAFFRNRTVDTNAPLDTAPFKILNIIRYPVDEKDWIAIKKHNKRQYNLVQPL